MRRLLLGVTLAVALFASRLNAQSLADVTALTFCVEYTDHTFEVRTLIDESIIGSDSAQEIQVHEKKHREQEHEIIKQTQHCPKLTDMEVLNMEIQAYCASRVYRMYRGASQYEADSIYLKKLQYQFVGKLPYLMIEMAYHHQCP